MWNLQASSKLVQQRSLDKNYEVHRQKLKSMESRMKIKTPVMPDFVYTKNKLNMSRRDRRVQIDKQNMILLSKMNAIKFAEYTTNKLRPEAQNLKTLNAQVMNIMNETIASENKKICEKLMRTQSFYPTQNIMNHTDHLEYVSQNISFNARRSKSQRAIQSARSRPMSSYTSISRHSGRKSVENFKLLSSRQPEREEDAKLERAGTAPMFTRSSKKIIVPQSGRPKVNYQAQETIEVL